MNGRVNDNLEATVTVTVFGPLGQAAVVGVIDTGYNGSLTLPSDIVAVLGLRLLISRPVRLGDASQRMLQFYEATVMWSDREQLIQALCVEGEPLVGTAMLKDFTLTTDFVVGGRVEIAPVG